MANCDIPDLDLFPARYGNKEIKYSSGMESALLHFGIGSLSWLVRAGLPIKPEKHAVFLLKASHCFDWIGTNDGGMHFIIRGKDHAARPLERRWFIVAKRGDGPQIPCVPARLLAKKLALGQGFESGAKPCLGFIKLDDYLTELSRFSISTVC